MHVLITGAAGMIGRKLTRKILGSPEILQSEITRLTLHDIVKPEIDDQSAAKAAGVEVEAFAGDLSDRDVAERVLAARPDIVFHLAAVVSGEAEADFDKGYAVNLTGTTNLLETIRAATGEYRPRFVFSSSIAVFGAPFPEQIPDDFLCAPLTSYGTQKAASELLLTDYTRRGVLEGVSVRLPTVCVRPGAPNKAASGFFSNIIRDPLAGKKAVLPVDDSVRHWFASPRSAVGFLLHAATIDLESVGDRRSITMPGVSATVEEQIEALRTVAGESAVSLIRREHDPHIAAMVAGWARDFAPERALALGFRAEESFEQIVRVHVEDELGGVPGEGA